MVFLATVLMLLFRQKYPRWWFDWNVALMRFGTRVSAYLALLATNTPRQMMSKPFTSGFHTLTRRAT